MGRRSGGNTVGVHADDGRVRGPDVAGPTVEIDRGAAELLARNLSDLVAGAEAGAQLGSGLGVDAPGFGRSFASWRAKARFNYQELLSIRTALVKAGLITDAR